MRFTPFVTRRAMLQQTLGGFGFLALAGLFNQAKASIRPTHFVPRAKRVILLFMQGGVSHLDTFDYKPRLNRDHGRPFGEQQAKILGCPWQFRQHGASGQWISELFPHLSEHADDLCVVTTLHTDQQAHQTAVPMFHTGSALQVRPSLGAWVVYGLGAES
ncbi:MAG: DUF1501 domain-containing protein, partial [Pirellulaceae bacterium]